MGNISEEFDIDLFNDPRVRGNKIIDDFDRLREHDPVYWSEKSHCWIVTRHQDVSDAFMGKLPLENGGRLGASALIAVPEVERSTVIPNLDKYLRYWVTDNDPPTHTRLRKLIMKAFTKRMVEMIRPYAKEQTNYLLDKAQGCLEIEFNEEIARPLPGYVIFKLLGMPEEHFSSLRDWSVALVEGLTAVGIPVEVLVKCDQAMADMNAVIVEELEKRKRQPENDLLTALLQASEDGESLSMEELVATMNILIVAGHESTSNTITLGVEALSRHPDCWQYIYDNPDNILDCMNELMRYISMSTGQIRMVGKDFEWHGKELKKGDIVALAVASANHDPRVFDSPKILDFTRETTQSQVFGPGLHHCIGHLLAKMQLCEFFLALTSRFDAIEVLDKELNFLPGFVFRGVYEMNVRFSPRA